MLISFVNISKNPAEYKDRIDQFLNNLYSERKFIYLTTDRILRAEISMVAIDGIKILGIAAIEKKYGIPRPYIVVNQNYHGQKFTRPFFLKTISEGKKKYGFLMGIVHESNIRAYKFDIATGGQVVGKRGPLYHLFWLPSGFIGRLLYVILKMIFPLIILADIIRKKINK